MRGPVQTARTIRPLPSRLVMCIFHREGSPTYQMALNPPSISLDPRDRLDELKALRRDILRRLHGAKMRKDWVARRAANAELQRVEDLIAFEGVKCRPTRSLSRF